MVPCGVRTEINMKKFGTVVGIVPVLKDVENRDFTQYVAENRASIVNYAKSMLDMDASKAEDFVHDVWISYKRNEDDGKCFSSDKGHGAYIDIEEAVKARMKKMKKKADSKTKESTYLKSSNSSPLVFAHFTDDTEDDDALQTKLSLTAKSMTNVIDEVIDTDLESDMMNFVACTAECRVPGMRLLEIIEQLASSVSAGQFSANEAGFLSDIWKCGEDMKEIFASIVKGYFKDPELYFLTLNKVREEQEECREMLQHHAEAVMQEKQECLKLLQSFSTGNIQ